MSEPDRFRELAPLAALDALDAQEAQEFAAHLAGCAECRRERDAFAAAADQLGLAVDPVAPPPALRARVLGAVGGPLPARRWPLAIAATLVLGLATGLLVAQQRCAVHQQRALHAQIAHDELRALLGDPGSRAVTLSALPAAPRAGGCVVLNAQKRRAVLFASGLQPAPAGQAYEVWVIAGGAPVPSGLFQVDARGGAVADLPWLDQTAAARTFAVTLEPAGGTTAPTGPMVLAGSVG